MGYYLGTVRVFINEGEAPGQPLPPGSPGVPPGFWGPGFPGQGLPGSPDYPSQGLPPSWGGFPERPGQGLPWPGYPGRPGQGLPWPGRPVDPGWGVEEGGPDQGLPVPPGRLPKAIDMEDHPDEPGSDGQWLLAAYGSEIRWVFLPRAELPEVEPPD